MAEFCKQCAEDHDFEPDFTGLFARAKIEPGNGMGFPMLCEGCGAAFIIDDEGTCGAEDCACKHGAPTDEQVKLGSPEWRQRADEFNRLLMGSG